MFYLTILRKATVAAVILMASGVAASADPLSFNLGGANLTGPGSVPGFFTIAVTGMTDSSATFTISSAASGATAPPSGSFISEIAFNVSGSPSGSTKTTAGGITGTTVNTGDFDFSKLTVTIGTNNQSLPPESGFDVLFDLPTSNSGGRRLSAGESITFTVNNLRG